MTDLCIEGGLVAAGEFSDSKKVGFNPKGMHGWPTDDCKLKQEYIDFFKKIITECPKHANDIEYGYYLQSISMIDLCSTDSVTGKKCGEIEFPRGKKYKNWESYQCDLSPSCLAEYDAVLREYAKSPSCTGSGNECMPFKLSKNPIESCGNPDYVDESPSSGNSSSNANSTTLINHSAILLSLIICLIFAIFK